jgi:hypothetical protein
MEDDILHPAFSVAAVKDELEMQMIVIESRSLSHRLGARQHW